MSFTKFTIFFTLINADKEYPVYTYADQYNNLMVLISAYTGISGFGLCCGMGSCGTCLVVIRESTGMFERNALSCDVKIDDYLSNTKILISESNY